MSRYNVEYNKKWACFSSVSDAFITEFMNKSEYEQWRIDEYGKDNFKPVEQCNQMTIEDAVSSIRLNRTHDKAIECLYECGLSKQICDTILFNIETDEYCPIKNENGTYKCPNCNKIIKKGQKVCDDETCNIEFIWR